MEISVEILREGTFVNYTLKISKDVNALTVLDVLNTIKEEEDPTLSYRSMCRSGICGTCAVKVNSKPVLACKAKVSQFGKTLKIEPLSGLSVVKDLVVDHEVLINRVKGIYSKEEAQPKTVYQEELSKLERSFECILCGVCDTVCPVIFEAPYFGGPMAFLRAYKHLMSGSKENAQRTAKFLKDKFINLCTHCKNCSMVCPKTLYPETAISEQEERLIDMKLIEKPNQQMGFDFLSF